MGAVKLVISRHIIELYKYQRVLLPDLDKIQNGGRRENGNQERSKEYVNTVNYRARQNIRRLALMNFTNEDLFITLTFKENIQNLDFANTEFKKFIQRVSRRMKKTNIPFKYLAVIEFQQRGAIHYHMLCNFDLSLIGGKDIKAKERSFAKDLWGNGFVDIADIKDTKGVDNIGAYLVKYMQKDFTDNASKLKDHKRYLHSRNLDKPIIADSTNLDFISALTEQYRPSYTSTYFNDYTGEVNYYEYNLQREGTRIVTG